VWNVGVQTKPLQTCTMTTIGARNRPQSLGIHVKFGRQILHMAMITIMLETTTFAATLLLTVEVFGAILLILMSDGVIVMFLFVD